MEHKVCALIFAVILSESFLIVRRTERDKIKLTSDLQVKHPLFFSGCNET
jgi:hypothetical protein